MESVKRRRRFKFQFIICGFGNGYESDFTGNAGRHRDPFDRTRRDAPRRRKIRHDRMAKRAEQRHRQQNSVRNFSSQRKSEKYQRFCRSRKAGRKNNSSRSGQFRRRAMVDSGDLRLGTDENESRNRTSRFEPRASNSPIGLEQRDFNARLGSRSANAV